MTVSEVPAWVSYPQDDWTSITPEQAGLDVGKWERFLSGSDVTREARWAHGWGVVLTRGGYLVHAWGDRHYKCQTASSGKAFTWALVGLAVDEGILKPDDPIYKTWTGEDQLSHPHKYLDQGHHKKLTWRHLLGLRESYGHFGGFPVTNGYYWRNRTPDSEQHLPSAIAKVPSWAKWTGDPFFDNYAHAEPGTETIYSSGGMWRLSQALTRLWDADIKQVLDQKLFAKIGIPADRWDWNAGRTVYQNKNLYPHMPGYGDFLDPPYEINGHVVRGGPGWVVMSASDLARFGHLVATQGVWMGQQLISPEWLRGHHGGDTHQVNGESTYYTAMGRVATQGIDHPLPEDLFVGPVKHGP